MVWTYGFGLDDVPSMLDQLLKILIIFECINYENWTKARFLYFLYNLNTKNAVRIWNSSLRLVTVELWKKLLIKPSIVWKCHNCARWKFLKHLAEALHLFHLYRRSFITQAVRQYAYSLSRFSILFHRLKEC